MKLFGTIKELIMENVKTPKLVFKDNLPAYIPPSLLTELMEELDDVPEPHKILFEKDEYNIIRKFEVVKDED
jgi:hypothetical protein